MGPKEVCGLACVLDEESGKTLWSRCSLDPSDTLVYFILA